MCIVNLSEFSSRIQGNWLTSYDSNDPISPDSSRECWLAHLGLPHRVIHHSTFNVLRSLGF